MYSLSNGVAVVRMPERHRRTGFSHLVPFSWKMSSRVSALRSASTTPPAWYGFLQLFLPFEISSAGRKIQVVSLWRLPAPISNNSYDGQDIESAPRTSRCCKMIVSCVTSINREMPAHHASPLSTHPPSIANFNHDPPSIPIQPTPTSSQLTEPAVPPENKRSL